MNNLNPQRDESSEAKIRFRCPNCSKLYISNPAGVFVEKPEYKCTSCFTSFSISLTEALNASEVVGYKIENPKDVMTEIEVEKLEKTPEPKFNAEDMDWAIVEERVSFKEDTFIDTLEGQWSLILKDFSNKEKHLNFINRCREQKSIDFVKAKYNEILKANPFDEVARACFNLIEIEEETGLLLAQEDDKNALNLSMWSSVVLGLGSFCLFVGFFVPQYNKLIGLGIGLIVFTFALKSLFRKNQALY